MAQVKKSEDHKRYGESSWQEHECQTHLMANQPTNWDLLFMQVKETNSNDHQSQQGYYLSLAQDSL